MTSTDNVLCLRCRNPTAYFGHVPVMTHGSSGAARLFLGQLAEVGEQNWQIDVYRCGHCGHLELFDLSEVNRSV
jgi:hypothetical protein